MFRSKEEFLNQVKPLAEELIDYAMSKGKSQGVSDVKISIQESEQQSNKVEKGSTIEVSSGGSTNIGVLLYAGNKIVSFSKNTFDIEALKAAIDENFKIIHLIPENPDKVLLEKEKVFKGEIPDLDLLDNISVPQEDLIKYAKEVEAAALAESNIKSVNETSITKNNSHGFILATNDLELCETNGYYQAVTSAIAEDDNGMQTEYDWATARHFSDMPKASKIGKDAARKATAKLSPSLPNTANMPIILSKEAAEIFISSVYSAIDGTSVYINKTFLKDKIGEQVMSEGLTIIDEPRIKRGLASSFVDSAGIETKKITFIENGVLKSYNVGLEESRQLGIEPIGRENGSTNITVLPGTKTPEELISDIKEGIYIDNFNGGQADVNTGIYSREGYGRVIKDGKLTDQAVSGFVVSGNLKDMFMNVTLADDTPKHPTTKGSKAIPTMRIDGCKIAGK